MPDTLPAWFWIPAAVLLWTALVCLYIADRRRRVETSPLEQAHHGHLPLAPRTRSAAALALHRVRPTSREGEQVARRAPHPGLEGWTHYTTEHGGCARTVQPASRREAGRIDHQQPTALQRRSS